MKKSPKIPRKNVIPKNDTGKDPQNAKKKCNTQKKPQTAAAWALALTVMNV